MNLYGQKLLGKSWIAATQGTWDAATNCVIQLWAHNQVNDGDSAYNWRTNEGGTAAPTLLYEGPAQYQVYRYTLVMDGPVGSADQIRTVRFTVGAKELGDVMVRKGQRIVITECENDPSVTSYRYAVNSGLNSASAFRRTIEAEVDMAQVI